MKKRDTDELKMEYMESIFINACWLEDIGCSKLANKLFFCLAEEKHSHSLIRIGNMFSGGYGVKKNHNKALLFYKKAWRAGDFTGAYNMAHCYKNDLKLYTKALYWFRYLIANKNSYYEGEATMDLAQMYAHGLGVKKNGKKAIKMLKNLIDNAPLFKSMSEGSQEEVCELLKSYLLLCPIQPSNKRNE
jgi:TPR repeat protein